MRLQHPHPHRRARSAMREGLQRMAAGGIALAASVLLAACSTPPPTPPVAAVPVPAPTPAPPDAEPGHLAGTYGQLRVYVPAGADTVASVAQQLLGDASLAWVISQANGGLSRIVPGQPILVPMAAPAAHGVSYAGVQTVPVLCYHRFTDADSARGNKMVMPQAHFEAQLLWLSREGYTVLRMPQLQAFLEGRQALPARSVLITVDDGWASFYRHGFPLLRKYGVPVTLFVYTDFIGTRDGLSWAQLREMAVSGLVDIQAHSKTHRKLTQRQPGENDAAWQRALAAELEQPRQLLERHLADVGVQVRYLAYPYGDADKAVLQALDAEPYLLGFTVRSGGNAFYAPPALLHRTMIYGDHSLEDFAARLQTRRPLSRP